MKILIVGNGAREHAIAKTAAKSKYHPELFFYVEIPNPGLVQMASNYEIGELTDLHHLVTYVANVSPDLVIVGPESPLAAGAVDALSRKGFRCIGPTSAQARIESDKSFMREFMKRYIKRGYPNWKIVTSKKQLYEQVQQGQQIVIKPVGLTGGKGVRVYGRQVNSLEEVVNYGEELLAKDGKVLIEEKLEGEEFSLMVFTDGKNIQAMPLVQDYKYAYENDTGPMTGGMGSFSCADHLLPFVSKQDYEEAYNIVEDVVLQLSRTTKAPYRGILYGQFMQTDKGPKVIEFNARFGDPEAINVLDLLITDFVDLCMSIIEGDLLESVEFANQATVCKYLVPIGYPTNPLINSPFTVPFEQLCEAGIDLFFANVYEQEGTIYTTASRALALLARAENPITAKQVIDDFLTRWQPKHLYYRKDIPKIFI